MTIKKYVINKNSTIINYDFRVGNKFMIRIKSAYKYETPFKGQYELVQTWKNGSVTL